MNNYAVLADLNSAKFGFATFERALEELDGRVVYAKFYGYSAKRNADFNAYIKTNACDVALPLQNRKKVRVDIRQVIDAVILACTNHAVDGFFIICSPIDAVAMVNALNALGKRVVMGVESPDAVSERCDASIIFDRGAELALPRKLEGADSLEAAVADFERLKIESGEPKETARTSYVENARNTPVGTQENFSEVCDAAAAKNVKKDEFLPFSGITGQEEDMEDVRRTLDAMLESKLEQKAKLDVKHTAVELDELLKKYF